MKSAKRKINIRESERALLTDTLPFEIPIFFSNENLAVLAYKIRKNKGSFPLHQKLLLSKKGDEPSTTPLNFEISRAPRQARRLSLMHPISQHILANFYSTHDQFICNACSRSPLSLRRPSRVATHYIDPRYATVPNDNLSQPDEDPAGFRDQSKWASTYFSYRDYSLSHKFFESQEFLELERRHSLLMTLDISRCFDSIYTHSIEWSMRGKEFSKSHLPKKNRTTFESSFDGVIRHGNWNETHGILVGPESSRVFAEVVLQSADLSIISALTSRGFEGVVRRYVDDYYVFSNSSHDLQMCEDVIRSSLLELNLHLNQQKREILSRPFVSKISVIRHAVSKVIDEFFAQPGMKESTIPTEADPGPIERRFRSTLSLLRRSAVETQSSYDQFTSFALSVIKKKLRGFIDESKDSAPSSVENGLVRQSWLLSILRIAQFLYSMDHRATTSFKIASIYSLAIELAERIGCARAPLERQILDGLRDPSMGSSPTNTDEITRINHLCTVDLLLTGDQKIEPKDLHTYIGELDDSSVVKKLSVLQLLSAIFVCRRRFRFSGALEVCIKELERRMDEPSFSPQTDTGHAILLTEFLACPHIDSSRKVEPYRRFHKKIIGPAVNKDQATKQLAKSSWISFVDWSRDFDLAAMLGRKELTPAYE